MGQDKDERKSRGLFKGKQSKLPGVVADYGSVEPKVLVDVIQIVSAKGGAIRFGYTRDGGAYAIGIYYDGEHETTYLRPDEDLVGYLTDIAETMRGLERR